MTTHRTTTIYFVRHGEYENPDKIVAWRLPGFPLSDQGRKDIEKLGKYFIDKNIEVIYSSPILRTKQSADILGKILGLKIMENPLIQEIYTPMQDQRVTYKELFKKRTIPYGEEFHIQNKGENFEEIFNRVNKLVNQVLVEYKDKNIIFVSHGDPIMIFWYKMLGKVFGFEELLDGDDYIPKSGIIKFVFDNSKFIRSERIDIISQPLR